MVQVLGETVQLVARPTRQADRQMTRMPWHQRRSRCVRSAVVPKRRRRYSSRRGRDGRLCLIESPDRSRVTLNTLTTMVRAPRHVGSDPLSSLWPAAVSPVASGCGARTARSGRGPLVIALPTPAALGQSVHSYACRNPDKVTLRRRRSTGLAWAVATALTTQSLRRRVRVDKPITNGGGDVIEPSRPSLLPRMWPGAGTCRRRPEIFRGIRFAQPPTGALRFKRPVAVEPWEGVATRSSSRPFARSQWKYSRPDAAAAERRLPCAEHLDARLR